MRGVHQEGWLGSVYLSAWFTVFKEVFSTRHWLSRTHFNLPICPSLPGLKVCTTTPRSKILNKLLKGSNWRFLSHLNT